MCTTFGTSCYTPDAIPAHRTPFVGVEDRIGTQERGTFSQERGVSFASRAVCLVKSVTPCLSGWAHIMPTGNDGLL